MIIRFPSRSRLAAAIQTCIQLLRLGLLSPHREARLRRRELRQRQQAEVEDLAQRMKQLQAANENKQRQLEAMRKVLCHAQHFKLKKNDLEEEEAITPWSPCQLNLLCQTYSRKQSYHYYRKLSPTTYI